MNNIKVTGLFVLISILFTSALANQPAHRCPVQNPCYAVKKGFLSYAGKWNAVPENPHCAVKGMRVTSSCSVDYCSYRDDCDKRKTIYAKVGATVNNTCGSSWNVASTCAMDSFSWDKTDFSVITPGSLFKSNCVGDLDVCFAIDESGSLKRSDFRAEIKFVRALVAKLVERMPADKMPRFSGFLFDQNVFGWNDIIQEEPTTDYHMFLGKLNDRYFDGGWTNISAGLNFCRESLQDNTRNRVTFLLSDGMQTVDANGNNRPFWSYNEKSVDWNENEEKTAVTSLATAMKDDGITVAVIGVYDEANGLDDEYAEFFREITSSGGSPRSAATMDGPDDTHLFYTFHFRDLGTIASSIMSEEVCADDVMISPGGLLTAQTCKCVMLTVANPGSCVNVVDDSTISGDSAVCEYESCSKERFACDVNADEASCGLVVDKNWVCKAGTQRVDGTCDCTLMDVQRVVFQQFLN